MTDGDQVGPDSDSSHQPPADEPSAPPPRAADRADTVVRAPGEPSQPERVAGITPLLKALQVGAALTIALVAVVFNSLSGSGLTIVLAIIGAWLVAVLIGWVVSYLSWQRLTFWFDGDGNFRIASGILTRQERHLQLSRLQGVDVQQPLMARLTGFAALRIEVAGGGDSRALLQYLTLDRAEALRAEVLARAAGLKPQTSAAPEQALFQVSGGVLAKSLMLRGSTIFILLFTVLLAAGVIVVSGWAGLFVLLGVAVPLIIVIGEFTTLYGFTVASSPDGLRTRSGLLSTSAQTIPPGRVHAVEFLQPFLWRRRNWVRAQVNVAGVAGGDAAGENDTSASIRHTMLIPVAPAEVAQDLVARLLPGLDVNAVDLKPAPPAARKRAWIQHSQLAVGANDDVLITRRGRFVRRQNLIPHARVQSVRVTQGPWERSLGLASMHADSVSGPVSISALYRDAAEARRIAERQIARTEHAMQHAGPERWMTRGSGRQPADPTTPPASEDRKSESGG